MNKQVMDLADIFIKQTAAYRDKVMTLQSTQFCTLHELEELQLTRFRDILQYCRKNIPFYREALSRIGKGPDDFQSLEDLNYLPIIDKRIVKDNFDMFLPARRPLFRSAAETSGTTGFPSFFFRDVNSILHEDAILDRFRNAGGIKVQRTAVFRGDMLFRPDRAYPPYWKVFPTSQQCVFSSYHLGEKTILDYDRMLREYRPEAIYAFPSVVYQLAYLYRSCKLDAYQPKIIYTSSEVLKNMHRQLIESVFGCRVRDWYGQVERVAAIGQCERGTYHIVEDYSLVEMMKSPTGFEVIGSSLENRIMPLLRYRTNDEIELTSEPCPCGRAFRTVKKIYGRQMKYLTTPEGRKVSFFLISDAIDVEDNIREVQFVQDAHGALILNIIPGGNYSERNSERVIQNIKGRTSANMEVVIHIVENIPRGPNGKVKDFILCEEPSPRG